MNYTQNITPGSIVTQKGLGYTGKVLQYDANGVMIVEWNKWKNESFVTLEFTDSNMQVLHAEPAINPTDEQIDEMIKLHTTAETNVYYNPIDGLWFAEIGVWFKGNYVMGITRGGYEKQSTATAQKTRLYNSRFQVARDFANY